MNSILGAFLAAVIAFGTALTALLADATVFSDITPVQWAILVVGGIITFAKDLQAIWARRQINKFTNNGDGGGTV